MVTIHYNPRNLIGAYFHNIVKVFLKLPVPYTINGIRFCLLSWNVKYRQNGNTGALAWQKGERFNYKFEEETFVKFVQ